MHILYLVPHVPNPTKVRSHMQIHGLVEAGHVVTVATLVRTAGDAAHVRRLEQTGVTVLWERVQRLQALRYSGIAFGRGIPLQAQLLWSDVLMAKIKQWLAVQPVDIIHVEHLRMAGYGLRLTHEWPVVWDAVDSLTSLYRQAASASNNHIWKLLARIEAPRLTRYEPWLTTQFPATLVISSRDLTAFQQTSPNPERLHLAPFGIPVTPFANTQRRYDNTLILTGSMNYHPNVAAALYFVREMLPRILRAFPDTRLQLVGANPAASIQALTGPHIEVTGFVESVADYLQQATIALAPVTYGSGIQIKVIEALLSGTPLVATPMAIRGLDLLDGKHLLIADTPDAFTGAIEKLLSNPELRSQLATEGRRFVEEHHNLIHTTNTLIATYQQILGKWHSM